MSLRKPRARWLVVLLLGTALVSAVRTAQERSAAQMTAAASRWLESLSPELRQQAAFAFESDERRHWHFVPTEMFPRNGLTLASMNETQRGLARELLRAGLSSRGFVTVDRIMNELEVVLRETERSSNFVRSPEHYRFSVFGTPSARGAWGWRVEGHHVSLHFTIVNGTFVASTPTFFGANPAEVRVGARQGLRVLAAQEDVARELAVSLDAAQRTKAVLSADAPNDIKTMNALDINPLEPGGIEAAALSEPQRRTLLALLDSYAGTMAEDIAADRLARVRAAGIDRITFAWMGSLERGQRHYYRVQGPTFLIEFDNTQNGANHGHSVWRDFTGDFGRDLLREHLKSAAH